MDIRVGILTLSASDNCGSLLQAYALQSVLEKRLGLDAKIIRFDSPASQQLYSIFPPRALGQPKKLVRGLLFYPVLKKQKQHYNEFRDTYLRMTEERFFGQEELRQADGRFDYIVTGSDQVWNIHMPDFDESFLLGWVRQARKVAYAPSLGGSTFEDYPDQAALKQLLCSYHALSTREARGQASISTLTGLAVPVLADPTLLVEREAWERVAGEPLADGDYIFYYSWAYDNPKMNGIVAEYARQKGLKVYVINASKWLRHRPEAFGFQIFPLGGPKAFLNLMKHAKMVFVESFHGVIFANKFEKDFYFLNDHEDGSLDPRLDSILTLYGRKDRVVGSLEDIRDVPVDYSRENPALVELVKASFAYLDETFQAVPAAEASGVREDRELPIG